MPAIGETLQVGSRAAWRRWLARHHATRLEIWLVLVKKHAARPGLRYDDALEEALCFGWIDGILKRIDDERHVQRFSPRRADSIWSDLNKQRVQRLIRAGKMTQAGLDAVRAGRRSGKWAQGSGRATTETVPATLEAALGRDRRAREGFANLAPSYRRQYIAWILDAKREETRTRRIRETLRRVAEGQRLGID